MALAELVAAVVWIVILATMPTIAYANRDDDGEYVFGSLKWWALLWMLAILLASSGLVAVRVHRLISRTTRGNLVALACAATAVVIVAAILVASPVSELRIVHALIMSAAILIGGAAAHVTSDDEPKQVDASVGPK
jgi:hypothetical protein